MNQFTNPPTHGKSSRIIKLFSYQKVSQIKLIYF